MRNLHKFIQENHGLEDLRELQQWEKGEIKQCDYKNHRIFILRCNNKGLGLVSARLNSNRKDISSRARNIIRAEKQILQDRVRCINAILQDKEGRIAASKSRLFSIVTNRTTQQKCKEFIDKVREFTSIKVRDRHINKFNRLMHRNNLMVRQQSTQSIGNSKVQVPISNSQVQGPINNNQVNKWVVNLSSVPLTPAQEYLLAKGPNFALAAHNLPNVKFISPIQLVCQKLSDQDVQELRVETNCLLRKAKTQKSNITKEERKALKELTGDWERIVLTADKGVTMVVLDKKDYMDKVEGLLVQLVYRTINTDPTNKLKAKLILTLKRIKRETDMGEGENNVPYQLYCSQVLWVTKNP